MPFRIPTHYKGLSIQLLDPGSEELDQYIAWLKQELALAETALRHRIAEEEEDDA